MIEVDPVVSDHADDPPAETSIAHDAIRSRDISYNDQDSVSGIGLLHEDSVNGPVVDPSVSFSVIK